MKEALIVVLNCLGLIIAGRLLYLEDSNMYLVIELVVIAIYILFHNLEGDKKC